MSKIKTKIVDALTGQPLGYGVTGFIVKASDRKGEQLGASFVSDDDGYLEIDSKLLDYTKNSDAVDIIVTTNGYSQVRVSPEEFELQPIKLIKKGSLVEKTKEKLKAVPQWAWEAGGWVLGASILITIIWKKVK